jgi:hypothetical protein
MFSAGYGIAIFPGLASTGPRAPSLGHIVWHTAPPRHQHHDRNDGRIDGTSKENKAPSQQDGLSFHYEFSNESHATVRH